jgi:hypothetical protein
MEVAPGHASREGSRPQVQAALLVGLATATTAGALEVLRDDLVQELGDGVLTRPGRFLEVNLERRRDSPSVDLGLSRHALHGNALVFNASSLEGNRLVACRRGQCAPR